MAANPIVTTQFGAADPNASPLTVNDLLTLLNQLVSSQIIGAYTPYVLQSATPGVDQQDLAWIQLDNSNRPIALKVYYNGNWRRVYNGMLGEIRMFAGDPTNLTFWDANGAGQPGQIYDGWQICNGLNGSPDMSNVFVLGGDMNDASTKGWNTNGWFAKITGPDGTSKNYNNYGQVAGNGTTQGMTVTLTNDNLPILSNADPIQGDPAGLWIYGKEAKESVDHPGTNVPLVDEHYANALPHKFNLTGSINNAGAYGKDPVVPIWTMPNFIALGFIIFQGYQT